MAQSDDSVDRWIEELPAPPVIELYLDYRQLTVRHVAELLACVDLLFRQLRALQDDRSLPVPSPAAPGRADSLAHLFGADQLQVYAIDTGQSITMKFTAGFVPKVHVNHEEVVIEVPKVAAALLLLGHLIDGVAGPVNSALDVAIKFRELKSGPLVEEKLEREVYELRHKVYGASQADRQELQRSLEEFRRLSVEHPEINVVGAHLRGLDEPEGRFVAPSADRSNAGEDMAGTDKATGRERYDRARDIAGRSEPKDQTKNR